MKNTKAEGILPPEPMTNAAVAKRLYAQAMNGLQTRQVKKKKLVWLELNGCSGNVISLLNGFQPDFEYAITQMVDLVYNNSMIIAMDVLKPLRRVK